MLTVTIQQPEQLINIYLFLTPPHPLCVWVSVWTEREREREKERERERKRAIAVITKMCLNNRYQETIWVNCQA